MKNKLLIGLSALAASASIFYVIKKISSVFNRKY